LKPQIKTEIWKRRQSTLRCTQVACFV